VQDALQYQGAVFLCPEGLPLVLEVHRILVFRCFFFLRPVLPVLILP
jgi:hypothetical protein